ncbi:MAG: hypothetical protein PWQ50_1460 [Methanolobus sp.]|jgi:DNA-directed RNA polymerase subunit RPC12/RpoP|nr:hypothetical protein [Methanolobus sp.]
MNDYSEDFQEEEEETSLAIIDEPQKVNQSSSVEDVIGTIIGIGAGLFLGMLGAAIIDSVLGYRCPNCNSKIEQNSRYCRYCNTPLRWD